jgi:hypothetical protein
VFDSCDYSKTIAEGGENVKIPDENDVKSAIAGPLTAIEDSFLPEL